MTEKYVRIIIILCMVAVMCGTGSAAVGIIAETQTISAGQPPACTAPCECLSENEAALRWGVEGYERCSKSICGQSANANIPYYCMHQIGGTSSPAVTTCQAPCECLSESGAISRWGRYGYTRCSGTTCGEEATSSGTVSHYCFRPWGSTPLVIGGTATTLPVQQTMLAPVQTPVPQAAVPSVATTVSPSYDYGNPGAIPQRTPVGIITILAAIGTVLMAVVIKQRK